MERIARILLAGAVLALARRNPSVVALEADLGKSTRSMLVKQQVPDRHFEMGIAEQNMVSTAAGLALAGKMPFVHSFAVFAAGRAYDQLRNAVCIPPIFFTPRKSAMREKMVTKVKPATGCQGT